MSMMSLRSEKSRAQLEAYLLSLEIEKAMGALPSADHEVDMGGRRRRFRGGGEVANKAFSWLWGTISGTLAPVGKSLKESDTAAALGQVLKAASEQPKAAAAAVDKAAAAAISSAVPVVQSISVAAPFAAVAITRSYLLSHPSLAVAIADYSSRLAMKIVDKMHLLGPSWGVFISELRVTSGIVLSSATDAATLVATRPYLALYISYLLLAQYASYKKTTIKDLLKTTGDQIAGAAMGMGSAAVGSMKAFGGDFVSVVDTQWTGFQTWLDAKSEVDDSLKALGGKIKEELKQKATDAKKDGQAKKDEENAIKEGAVAPPGPPAPGLSAEERGAPSGGRRLTSRRRRRAAYLPRQTRRSSSGRRRGYSRRRRE